MADEVDIHGDDEASRSPAQASTPGIGAASARAPAAPPAVGTLAAIAAIAPTDVERHIVILGGWKADHVRDQDIISWTFDPDKQHSIIAQAPVYTFSVCDMPDAFVVSGGRDCTTRALTSCVRKFSLTSRVWTELPDLLKPCSGHGSAYLDGRLYTLGGRYQGDGFGRMGVSTDEVRALDLATLTWTACQPLPLPLDRLGVAVVGTDILTFGGRTMQQGGERPAAAFRYNSTTGKWTVCRNMPQTGCIFKSTVAVNNQVFLLDREMFLQYDVPTDTWTQLPLPPKPSKHFATFLHEGRLFALGGSEWYWKKPNDRVQTYHLARKTWTLEEYTMPTALTSHSAIVVNVRPTE